MKNRRIDRFPASSRSLVFLLFICSLLFHGCTKLPDTSGYTIATIQVKQAVATTGDVVKEELMSAIQAEATSADQSSVKDFEKVWAVTLRSLDAMVVHAQSIEQIVDAGNKGAQSAKAVADSVKNLVDTVKVDTISGTTAKVFELSADTVAFVYGEYSKHVSAKSLEDALDKFGPSITKITVLIQAQMSDAHRLFDEQTAAQYLKLQSDLRYGSWIKRHGELDTLAALATQLLVRALEKNNTSEITKAKTMLADLDVASRVIAPRMAAYREDKAEIAQREKIGRSIIGSAELAVAAWGSAHQQLVKAVKERKAVSVESLTATITEIRTLIQRWREL
jgi:hypothetical protein